MNFTRRDVFISERASMPECSDSTDLEVEIRVATVHDLGPLTSAFGPEFNAAQMKRRLEESENGLRTMLVAVNEGQVLGCVSIGGCRFQRKGSLRLFALDVGPAFRRKGVGSALLKTVETIADQRGFDEVNLEVEVDNIDAIQLYRRLGYQTCGNPVMDRWTRFLDDGSSEKIAVPVFVMVKKLNIVAS